MRKIIYLGVLLLSLGCKSTVGPFQARPPQRVDDPNYSIPEQQSRGRDRLGLPDDFSGLAPSSGAAIPGSGYPTK